MHVETAKRIAHLKELVRQQSQQMLAQAVEATAKENRKLAEMLTMRQQHEAKLEEMLAQSQPVPARFWVQWEQFQQQLEEQILRQRQQVEQAKQHEENRRQEVLARAVDENRWHKIRQMIFAQRVAEMQRQEQKELDDMASTQFVYRR